MNVTTATTATPAEIDARLFDLYMQEAQAEARVDSAVNGIHTATSDRKRHIGRSGNFRWESSDQAVIDRAREIAASDTTYVGTQAQRALDRLDEANAKVQAIRDEAAPLHAEFTRRGGWTRAFLVQQDNGHVHRSMGCSTCRSTTRFAWMVEYSGKDEAEIVEAAGERACTVCYPSAPVEALNRPTQMFGPDEIARQQAAAEREAKRQAKAAKAIAMPDGSPLRNEYGTVKTERSAEIEAVKALADDAFYGYTHPSRATWLAFVERAIEALAAKRGQSADEVRKVIETKAAAKIKRDARG